MEVEATLDVAVAATSVPVDGIELAIEPIGESSWNRSMPRVA